MRAAFQSDENLREALKEVLGELGLSAREFSKASDIPQSTLYKILSGHREPNITTLRQIVKTIRQLEGSEGNFIAIIAARPVLDKISGSVLLGTRQRQARSQLLTAFVEQLLVDSKRARDVDTTAMNMQLVTWRDSRAANAAFVAGTGDALRTWRQP